MPKYIDSAPPVPTGDPQKDVKALTEYIRKLQEQLNFILSLIYRGA